MVPPFGPKVNDINYLPFLHPLSILYISHIQYRHIKEMFAMLTVTGLTKRFGSATAVHDVSLHDPTR